MKIWRSLDELPKLQNTVLTQGTFDGVHIGHVGILRRVAELAKEVNGESVLLTFFPHPRMVLFPEKTELKLLTTIKEKAEILEQIGIRHLVILPFTKELSALSPFEYAQKVLRESLHLHTMVVGYDHRFGHNREGDFDLLQAFGKQMGFAVEEIPAELVESVAVSSTKIRNALLAGDTQTAAEYLGRPYSLTGEVVVGDKMGRQLGYPTANLKVAESYKLIPADGVYAVKVHINGETYNGMLNIGKNPTFPEKGNSIEVNIFKFARHIYGQFLQVSFYQKLRDELRFDTVEELTKQLDADKKNTEKYFNPD